MSLLKNVIGYGLHADRPAASSEGRLYYETDTNTLWRDNASMWEIINALPTAPSVRASYSTPITVPNNTAVMVPFDTTDWDDGTLSPQHQTGINPSRLVCQRAGIYVISAGATYDYNVTGARDLAFVRNGISWDSEIYIPTNTTDVTILGLAGLLKLDVDDYLELQLYQNSGSDIDVHIPGAGPLHMEWCRVG